MVSLQHFLDHTPPFLLTQEPALKTVREISLRAPQPISPLHEGLMGDAGLWHRFPPRVTEPTHQAPLFRHPVHHRRSCTNCRFSQRLTSCISSPNISAQKALPAMTDRGRYQCGHDPGASALDDLHPAVIMKSL